MRDPNLPPLCLVVARAANGVIGADGGLPWRLPEDLKRFKQITMGKPCIMGRKTWESLPKKPLPGRRNIVVTRQAGYAAEGATVVPSFEAALEAAAREHPPEIMVIGGAGIFAAALPLAGRVYLTEVHADPGGDVCLAAFDPQVWQEKARESAGSTHSYVTLERRSS
jgi:dihydrofolate reductase